MKKAFNLLAAASCFFCGLLAVDSARAGGEARYFRIQSQDELLAGTLDGIAVDALGTLSLADRVQRVADLGEPFLFAVANHPQGWVVGTGNGGKVLLVRRDGSVETLFSAPEPEVFAVWADADGTVFAGTSPAGKVYRLSAGQTEEYFDPGETYIWHLARDAGGDLLVATGTEGRLFRVSKSGSSEVLFDSDDTHLRSLKVLADGDILVGTAGEGLILRLDGKGGVRTLHDGAEPEVVALAEGPDGSCYAAALASEASLVDLAAARAKASGGDAAKEDGAEAKGEGEATVTISSESTPAFVGSRPAGFKGAHSSVLRISPAGVVEKLWEFDAETVYSLRWHGNRLWVGTGLDGKLYSLRDRKMVLEKDVDERQIVALADGPTGPVFATTNASAVFSVSAESEPRGVYTSAALDAVQVARFGTLRWLGDLPAGAKVRFSARSGMSGEPDRTWSSWTPQADGREVSLGAVPVGRFLQWRAELESANGREPTLTDVTVSYVQENLAPRVERFTVREPGEIIVPANFNPGTQVFEPTSPTRGGIFTTLVPAERKDEGRRKTLWKKGYRTLTWDAEDPNDDDLVYSLRFRRESPPSEWLQMAEDLEDTHYSFDAAALADGTYRFLLQAVDRPDDGADEGLMAEEISEPVIIDNSVPELNGVERTDRGLEIELTDAWSPLRSVRVSVDAGDWRQLTAADGLLDGRREKLIIALPESADLLLVQAMDASFNLVTFDLSKELP